MTSPPPTDVVIAVQAALAGRDRARFGIDAFQARGLQVGVIDAADVAMAATGPHRRDHYRHQFPDLDIAVLSQPGGWDKAGCMLSSARLIIQLVGTGYPQPSNLRVLRMLARSKAPILIPSTNVNPASTGRKTLQLGLWQRLRRAGLANALLTRVPLRLLGLRPADYILVGGTGSRMIMRLATPRTKEIRVHAYDYDLFLTQWASPAPSRPIAVYLDTYMGFHPDSRAERLGMPVDPDVFYPLLRHLMDRIERELGLEVVIAAHPRADYSDKPGLFGNRRPIPGHSVELVQSCRLALGIHSTSSSFAVLFEKPLMVLATRDLVRHPSMLGTCESLAAALGREIDWLDDPAAIDLEAAMHIDRQAYDRYRAIYLKQPGSPEKPYWDIVAEALAADGVMV